MVKGWDSDLLAALPPAVAAHFPFVLTPRCGVTKQLLRALQAHVAKRGNFAGFASMLEEQRRLQHHECARQYLSGCEMAVDAARWAQQRAAAAADEQARLAEQERNKISLSEQRSLQQKSIMDMLRPARSDAEAAGSTAGSSRAGSGAAGGGGGGAAAGQLSFKPFPKYENSPSRAPGIVYYQKLWLEVHAAQRT